jgi:hypothetical protein
VKATTTAPRASHVNAGTAVPQDELPWPITQGRVVRLPKTDIEVDERSEVTPYGGLALFSALARRFRIAERVHAAVRLFKIHLPYHESDHELAIAANLFVGKTCLEDQANLQRSEAVCRLLSAVRVPDPTTALRRPLPPPHPPCGAPWICGQPPPTARTRAAAAHSSTAPGPPFSGLSGPRPSP